MLGLVRLLMIVVGVIGGSMYFFKNLLNTNQWRKGISQADLDMLRESVSDLNQHVVELDRDELKLLSLNKEGKKLRKNGKKLDTGIFFSIYNEPLVKYAIIEFDKFRKLIYVATSGQDYVYRVTPKTVDIYCNENYLGFLDIEGKLRAPVSKEMLISIENQEDIKYQRIENSKKELCAVLNPLLVDGPNQRVIQYEELEDNSDRILALSLILLNMIERS